MSFETWPTTPLPTATYIFDAEFQTLVSNYEGENEVVQMNLRFARRGFMLVYNNKVISSDGILFRIFYKT